MRKIFLIFISIILVLGFVYFLNNLEKIEKIEKAEASPGATDNVWGWAWSENIGWISFNSTNTGAAVNYGVNIDGTGLFSGYAWAGGVAEGSASGTIGWISFAPSGPYPEAPNYSACLDLPGSGQTCDGVGDYQVSGWARALATDGGWDGWIHLRNDPTYGVFLNPGTREFEGWAAGWDDSTSTAVIGWISFNCKDGGYNEGTGEHYDICATSNYKVMTSLSLAPVVSNPTSTYSNPCLQSRIPTLSWNTTAQKPYNYEIQIDNDENFGSPNVTSTVTLTNSTSWTPPSLTCRYCCDVAPYNSISFGGGTYYWRVRVSDDNGTSTWATSTFTTKAHCYPAPDFTPSPLTGTVGQVITFKDESTCYGTPCSYLWDFGDRTTDTTVGTTTYSYKKTGRYEVKLRLTDNDLQTCTSTPKTVTIQAKLPWWKEIIPF